MLINISPKLFALFALPILAILASALKVSTPRLRAVLGLFSPLAMMLFFANLARPDSFGAQVNPPSELTAIREVEAYCGILFNFIYAMVFIGFGQRIFATRAAAWWLLVQLLISLALVAESTALFSVLICLALASHLRVSQADVYQVSKKQDRYILVVFSSLLAIVMSVTFFSVAGFCYDLTSFSALVRNAASLPAWVWLLSSALMMTMLGAFPMHFWVKPLFAAPARYGLAVITRLNLGFVVWCKLYPFIFSNQRLLDTLLIYGCAANLLYAAFLLFGERRISQIVSSLYLFHVPLLILAVREGGRGSHPDFLLDFANITVAISGLLIILGMLRDRLGAESLDSATGLGTSYPFFGIAFLVCVLSLVGFPGTLGFVSSEVILHHLAESTWPVAVCFIITLALNGYSSFRVFGESFYGDPAQSFRSVFQPIIREKVAVGVVLLFLFASGLGPILARK
jgi:NADH:ubiquinone oxidoreductase subunit 2 (subunit N)